jgi:ABC-type antimicrobial peptide transport system permease subunit
MSVHIGIGFKSRMKNTASKKKTCLGFLLIVFLAYVVCYLLSQTVFHEVYLFEWTAAHYYLCLWVASVTFCFLEMYRAALITTAGNWTGILIGQVLGDFIIKINATKITPDMYIGKVWQLKAHYGVLIWLLVFLLSFVIGMIVEKKNHC